MIKETIKNWKRRALKKLEKEYTTIDAEQTAYTYLDPLHIDNKEDKQIWEHNLEQLGISKNDIKEITTHKKKNPEKFIIKKYEERLSFVRNKHIQKLAKVLSDLIKERKIQNITKIEYDDLIPQISKMDSDLYIYMAGKTQKEKNKLFKIALKQI